MEKTEIASIVYLSLLGVALVGSMLSSNRHQIGKLARFAIAWGFIIIGGVVLAGYWPEIRQNALSQQTVIEDTGEIADIPDSGVQPPMSIDVPDDMEMSRVDIVVRLKRNS